MREDDRIAVATFIDANWPVEFGPLAWPNVRFSVPDKAIWASVEIIDYDTMRTSVSSDFLIKHLGAVQFDFYTPEGQGTTSNRSRADEISDLFHELVIPSDTGSLQFGTPKSRSASLNELRALNLDDNWSRYTLTCSYHKYSRIVK